MKRIYKFIIPLGDDVVRDIHEGAQFLSLLEQDEQVVAYFMIEEGKPMVERRFRVVGTGHPCDDVEKMNFLGTAKLAVGRLILHVFMEV